MAYDSNASGHEASGAAAVATLEPQTLPQSVEWLDEPTESYIEIFHLPEYRMATGIEVLSPSNKVNPGRIAYLAKRVDLLHHGVNLVEIDMLLSGARLPMLAPLRWGTSLHSLPDGAATTNATRSGGQFAGRFQLSLCH